MQTPSYFDPSRVGEVWTERAGLVADAAEAARRNGAIKPAASDAKKVVAFGIDCQIGFSSPGASLFVPGAVEDTARTIRFLYENLEKITKLVFSLDTHSVHQIFHPAFWVDSNGAHPAPFTNISLADVEKGTWRPASSARAAIARDYTKKLEERGKYRLTIWPYHTLLGGVSHALVPSLMEATIFHSLVRETSALFETKGTHPLTENYSVFSPEVTDVSGTNVGAFNEKLFEELLAYDEIYVFGQAKSHCVLSTLQDLAEHLKKRDPKLLSRVKILVDAMSPVPSPPIDPLPPELDFAAIAERGLAKLAADGMQLVKTTDPV